MRVQLHEPRNFRMNASASNLAPMASDPEHILQSADDPSYYSTFRNPPPAVQEQAINLEATLELEHDGPPSRSTLVSDVEPTLPEPLIHPLHCASTRQTSQEEARRVYSFDMDTVLIKAAEEAPFYSFKTGYEDSNNGLTNALFYLVETLLTEMENAGH